MHCDKKTWHHAAGRCSTSWHREENKAKLRFKKSRQEWSRSAPKTWNHAAGRCLLLKRLTPTLKRKVESHYFRLWTSRNLCSLKNFIWQSESCWRLILIHRGSEHQRNAGDKRHGLRTASVSHWRRARESFFVLHKAFLGRAVLQDVQLRQVHLEDLYIENGQTSHRSFSTVSEPNFCEFNEYYHRRHNDRTLFQRYSDDSKTNRMTC